MHRDQFDVGPLLGEVVEAALELIDLAADAAAALRKHDQRIGGASLPQHQIDRALVHLDGGAIDQDRIEDLLGEPTANDPTRPVVFGGDGPRHLPHRLRQRGPDDESIEVARVVGKVDSLAGVGLARDPADAGAGQEAGQSRERQAGHPAECGTASLRCGREWRRGGDGFRQIGRGQHPIIFPGWEASGQ